MVALAREERARYVIPVGEASLLALLERRADFPAGAFPWPSLPQVRAICDKATVLAAAAPLGVRIPTQAILHSPRDDVSALRFPVVVKPARSVAGSPGRRRKFGAVHTASLEALHQALHDVPPEAYPVLAQERIVGPGIGIFLLRWGGATQGLFAHRRIREKPPAGGVSVYREAIAADPDLVRHSEALLAHFDWQGVAMVEYKVDQGTGIPVLMEINGRFWGSLQLAIDAGVDFPRLLLDCADGKPPGQPSAYMPGTRLRWWWGDVDQLLARLRHEPAALGLPPGAPGRWAAIRDFLTRHPEDRSETWRRDDPAPFRHETLAWFGVR